MRHIGSFVRFASKVMWQHGSTLGRYWAIFHDVKASPWLRWVEKQSTRRTVAELFNLDFVLDWCGIRRLTRDDFSESRSFETYETLCTILAGYTVVVFAIIAVASLWISDQELVSSYLTEKVSATGEPGSGTNANQTLDGYRKLTEGRASFGEEGLDWRGFTRWILVMVLMQLFFVLGRLIFRWRMTLFSSSDGISRWLLCYVFLYGLFLFPRQSYSSDGIFLTFPYSRHAGDWSGLVAAVVESVFAVLLVRYFGLDFVKISIHGDGRFKKLRSLLTEHQVKNLLEPLRNCLRAGRPELASRYLETLAEHLPSLSVRFEADTWPLEAELGSVQRQLLIDQQRIRSIVYRVDKGIWGQPASGAKPYAVPPMLLQPLIENAVAAASGYAPDGGLYFVLVRATADAKVTAKGPEALILDVASWHRPRCDGLEGWERELEGAERLLTELRDSELSRPILDSAEKNDVMRGHELTYRYARSFFGNGAKLLVGRVLYELQPDLPGLKARDVHLARLVLNGPSLTRAGT